MTPVMAMAHKGSEPHCNVNNYEYPCYDDNKGIIVESPKEQAPEVGIVKELQIVSEETKTYRPKKDHFIKWFEEGVLVCANIHTKNLVASELLLDPTPEWRYGVPDFWKKEVKSELQKLGNFYYCRYTLYR